MFIIVCLSHHIMISAWQYASACICRLIAMLEQFACMFSIATRQQHYNALAPPTYGE